MPGQDPPARLIDERPRFYMATTPRGARMAVELGGADDQVSITRARPIDIALGMNTGSTLDLSREEAWALWACLTDGLGVTGEPPEWVPGEITPTDTAGDPLPPLPGALPPKPF